MMLSIFLYALTGGGKETEDSSLLIIEFLLAGMLFILVIPLAILKLIRQKRK